MVGYYSSYKGYGHWGHSYEGRIVRKISPATLNYPKSKILKMLKDNYVSQKELTEKFTGKDKDSQSSKTSPLRDERGYYWGDDDSIDFFKDLNK